MNYKIPSGVVQELLDCHKSLADQTFDIFGVECDLFFIKKKSIIPISPNNKNPVFNSINSRRRVGGDFNTSESTIVEEEVTEKIRVKVYLDSNEWYKMFGFLSAPKDKVLIISKLEDSDKLNQAVKLRYTDQSNNIFLFYRDSKVLPYSFQKKYYGSSIWKYEE